jgi:hypothetical protein
MFNNVTYIYYSYIKKYFNIYIYICIMPDNYEFLKAIEDIAL